MTEIKLCWGNIKKQKKLKTKKNKKNISIRHKSVHSQQICSLAYILEKIFKLYRTCEYTLNLSNSYPNHTYQLYHTHYTIPIIPYQSYEQFLSTQKKNRNDLKNTTQKRKSDACTRVHFTPKKKNKTKQCSVYILFLFFVCHKKVVWYHTIQPMKQNETTKQNDKTMQYPTTYVSNNTTKQTIYTIQHNCWAKRSKETFLRYPCTKLAKTAVLGFVLSNHQRDTLTH